MKYFSLLFLSLILSFQTLNAHVVEQLFGDYTTTEGEVQITLRFDAGLSLPEMRADKAALQPRHTWLTSRSPQELEHIKAETEKYLHEYLQFIWIHAPGGEKKRLDFECTFPAWASSPPKFEERFTDTGFAYFDVICRSKIPPESGELTLALPDGDYPDLAISFPNKNILTVYPDGGIALLTKEGDKEMASSPQKSDTFINFLIYGYRHVIPEGWDHVLFILALVCLTFAWQALLKQSLIFTLGHTITLGLAVSSVIPPLTDGMAKGVEIFIAATIAYVAIENLISNKVKPHRLVMIFFFGLIHGLGFASVLGDKIRAAGDIAMPLIAANLGVELGQVTVIALTLSALFWARKKPYFHSILKSISAVIALTGCYWIIERTFF